jgi:hypothetical protein
MVLEIQAGTQRPSRRSKRPSRSIRTAAWLGMATNRGFAAGAGRMDLGRPDR